MPRPLLPLLLASLAACRGGGSPASGGSAPVFDPPAPAWRGGCFWEANPALARPEKLADGFPGPEVVAWGCSCRWSCATFPYPTTSANRGGLVYLDGYDPGTFSGDVAVLTDGPGSVPRVVARRGGAGANLPGSPVARLSPRHTGMLVLRDVAGAAGTLVLVDLPDAAAPRDVAPLVRIANYEWLSESAFLYVGNYRARSPATASLGDLFYQERGGAPQPVATGAGRFDFTMYRLTRDKGRVAWISGPGELFTAPLPPGAAPAERVAAGVAAARFADDGTLVFLQPAADQSSYALSARLPGGAVVAVDASVDRAALAGDRLVWLRAFSLPGGFGALQAARLADLGGPAAPALLSTAAAPVFLATAQALAWVDVAAGAPSGALRLGPTGAGSFASPDPAVTPAGGLTLSPQGSLVAYTTGYEEHPSPSSPNPMPGVAAALCVAPVTGGAPLTVAVRAHARAAFSDDDRLVAALGSFEPARGRGELVLRATDPADPTTWTAAGVGADGFAFGAGGTLAVLRDWDDGLALGTLALGTAASGFAAVDSGVSAFGLPQNGRVLYGIRVGPRAGLWVGGN